MGGGACKVVNDWYAALAAEAYGFGELSKAYGHIALSAEAFALWESSKGICESSMMAVNYIDEESGPEAPDIRRIVEMSGKACDWATDLRGYNDKLAGAKGKATQADIAEWITDMRSWRDQGAKLTREIAMSEMPPEWFPPAKP